jgi:hypothetical protein
VFAVFFSFGRTGVSKLSQKSEDGLNRSTIVYQNARTYHSASCQNPPLCEKGGKGDSFKLPKIPLSALFRNYGVIAFCYPVAAGVSAGLVLNDRHGGCLEIESKFVSQSG